MKILITGATSKIGQSLIPELLKNSNIEKFYILSRTKTPSGVFHLLNDSRIHFLQGDLTKDLFFLDEVGPIDLCLHMAALTHSLEAKKYFEINEKATKKLADRLYSSACKEFIFMSSHTAGLNAGAYAESKFLAEKYLLSMPWTQLLILRPSEVVGTGGKEGLDKFENLAKNFKIYPWILSFKKIQFSPLRIEELVRFLANTFKEDMQGNRVQILRGPIVSSTQLAAYFWKKHRAIPIPVFLPFLKGINQVFTFLGFPLFPADQVERLLGARGQRASHKSPIEDVVLDSPYKDVQNKKVES